MIIIRKKAPTAEKRYRVPDVAKATGLSEGQVSGFFNNRGETTKDGLTLDQIDEVCRNTSRTVIRWKTVEEIRTRLMNERGIEIIEQDDPQEEMAI